MPCDAINFSIADITFNVRSSRPDPINWLKEKYALYFSKTKPQVLVNILYSKSSSLKAIRQTYTCSSYDIYNSNNGHYGFDVYVKGKYIGVGDLFRFLTGIILIRKRGFLAHSCGVLIDDYAYLFSGPSGAGKTTTARLFADKNTLLSDETVALRKIGNTYYAFATPFFGDFGSITSGAKAGLKAILFLKQAKKFGHFRLEKSAAVSKLIQNVFLLGKGWKEQVGALVDIAQDVALKIPCYEFEFKPEKKIWKYISAKISPGV